jgi:hypothetical protein
MTGDEGDITTTYTCMPLPAACGATPTCACLSGETCGYNCMTGDGGVLLAQCAGP